MNIIKVFLLIFSFIFTTNLFASDNEIQRERFESHLKELKSAFVDDSGNNRSLEDVVSSLLRGKKRVASFNLQALGRVYANYSKAGKDYSSLFKSTIRYEFKSIEDAIGEIKQHMEHLEDSDIKKSKQIKHELYKAAAIEAMKYVLTGDPSYLRGKIPENFEAPNGKQVVVKDNLTHEGEKLVKKFKRLSDKNYSSHSLFWNKSWFPYNKDSKLQQLSQTLFDFKWGTYREDRSYLLLELSYHLDEVSDSKYDFKFLENGDDGEKGLHEFRREVRWFSFQAGVLNGTVDTDDGSSCPIKKYKNIVDDSDLKKSSYTKFPKTPFPQQENVCKIPRCLYYKMADVIAEFGDLKDDSKKYNRKHDIKDNITPKKYRKEAEKIYDEVTDNKLFKETAKALRSCI